MSKSRLDAPTIASYKAAIEDGHTPTALALSLVDARYPSSKGFTLRLMHFLLDGHHKLMAAYELGQPVTLLSFLNVEQSFARKEWVDWAIRSRYD